MKMKKRITAAVTTAALCVSLSGCVNYGQLMKEDQWKYITVAAGNTFSDLSAADKKVLSGILPKNGEYTSAALTVSHPENGRLTVTSAQKDNLSAFGISADYAEKTYSAAISSDGSAMNFSVKGSSADYSYTIPYSDLKEKMELSVFGTDSGSRYALDKEDYEEIQKLIEDYCKKLTDKNETVDPFENRFTVTAENKEVLVGGENISADVITYSIDADTFDDMIAEKETENLKGYLDDSDLEEYIAMLREKTDLRCDLTFAINKDHRLVSVDGYFGGSYYDSPLEIRGGISFGAVPKKSENTNLYFKFTDGQDKESTAVTIGKAKLAGNVLSKSLEIISDDKTVHADLTIDAAAEKYTVSAVSGNETFTAEGGFKADSHSINIDLQSVYRNGQSENLLNGWVIGLNINDSAPQMIAADREFLSLTESEIDKFIEDLGEDIYGLYMMTY